MAQYRVYNRKMLARFNPVYLSDYAHRIEKCDVRFTNKCIKAMFHGLGSTEPKVGDVIQYTEKDGTYYPAAHIDSIDNEQVATVCLSPFIPFISLDSDGKVSFSSVSGGPWVSVPLEKLKHIGTTDKICRFFGSSGVCAHGAIDFKGYASCWEFQETGPFADFSTKLYSRTVFSRYKKNDKWYAAGPDPENIPAKIEDVPAWLAERKGKQFGDFLKDEVVTVFTYKEKAHLISLKEWQKLDLPQSTRRMNNSSVYVKLAIDDETKTIDVYRYENKLGMVPWN